MREQKKCKRTNEKGITLIALIISIIVMLILAGVSINAIVGDNGIITEAIRAALASTYSTYLEELQMSLIISGNTPTVVSEDMVEYIESMKESDYENFIIIKGELYYIGSNEEEISAAQAVRISADLSGGSAKEVMVIIESVVTIEDESEYIGIELLDKIIQNSETWKLAIDYNSSNVEITRYGTGYYLISPGDEITVEGETITFTDYYVVDYANQTLISSNNIVYWDVNSTVAVSEGMVLNIDPTNMTNIDFNVSDGEELYENGTGTGILKYGDVEYDDDTSALLFNESESNTAGEGGYLSLTRSGVDFSSGFTFEIYANLTRLRYDNGTVPALGLFCRIPTLTSTVTQSLRFGYTDNENICKFNNSSSWFGTGDVLKTTSIGGVCSSFCGYSMNSDFYLTFVYIVYDDSEITEYEEWLEYYGYNDTDEYSTWWNYNTSGDYPNGVDLVEYYVNGELYGYTFYGADSYANGCDTWNNDECPFFIGVCPWYADGNLYYLKGSVYTTRLYTYSMTEDEVSENYSMTLKYINSFAN